MIEEDIRQLDERAMDRSLDRLEADMWRGVALRARQREAARQVTSFQAVVMVLALLASVAAGISVARPDGATTARVLLFPETALLPSSLLLGQHP